MLNSTIKHFILLLGFILPASWGSAIGTQMQDGYSHIQIKESQVQGEPKGSSIQASVDGHWLSVVFLENLGQVNIQVSRVNGGDSQIQSSPTPNGMDFYIQSTGDYVVYFTLPNNDVYYGEFEITD